MQDVMELRLPGIQRVANGFPRDSCNILRVLTEFQRTLPYLCFVSLRICKRTAQTVERREALVSFFLGKASSLARCAPGIRAVKPCDLHRCGQIPRIKRRMARANRPMLFSKFYSNLWLIFGRLYEARSRLYQRQILQVNTHFSAFFEIYQIHIPLHRCTFKISRFF